jgi:hypothetical protein
MMPRTNLRRRALAAFAITLAATFGTGADLTAQAGHAVARSAHVNTTADGIAIKGYDPVAYFTTQTPTPGLPSITAVVEGVTYRFATAANRDAFVAAPATYTPQYGGYCAMGMAGGRKFDIDPLAWRVEQGRLYLNKDPNTQRMWLRDVPGNIRKADERWPDVLRRAP